MAEPGFFGSLANTMQSPLFLGGVGLLSGGGMQGMSQGIQTGILGQRQQFDQEQQRLDRMRQQQQDAENMRRWNTTDARAAETHPLDMELKRAHAMKYLVDAEQAKNGGDVPMPIKEWQRFQAMAPEQQQQYLLMKRAAEKPLDTGTAFVRPNALTPGQAPTPIVNKDVVGKETQAAIGKKTGEGIAGWSKAEMAYKQFETKSTLVDTTIDKAVGRIGSTTAGMGSLLASLPGTEARALKGDLDTIRANLGFGELQAMRESSPTGGALGSVSERENTLLQSTKASIDQALSGSDLATNLKTIKKNLAELRTTQREKFAADRARFGGGSVAPSAAPASAAQPAASGWSAKRID